MYKIVEKRKLNDNVVLVKVDAPFIARKVLPDTLLLSCVPGPRAVELAFWSCV